MQVRFWHKYMKERTPSMSGIAKAAMMRKQIKRAEKVRMIAEGNELANANINLFKKL